MGNNENRLDKTLRRHVVLNQVSVLAVYLIALYYCVWFLFPFDVDHLRLLLINYLLLLPSLGLLLLLMRNLCVSIAVHSLLFYLLCYADRVLYKLRFIHLRYSDFFAVMDGLRVANKYTVPFSRFDTFLLVAVVLFNVCLIVVSKKMGDKESKIHNAIIGAVILLISGFILIWGSQSGWIPDTTDYETGVFDSNTTTEEYGLFYTLYNQYRNSRISEPEGYSKQRAQAILARYDGESVEKQDPTDIIVIMNESLTDYSLIGGTAFLSDQLPNIHNAENGYKEGKLAVSVYAGYTCNTEYEFLTGNTLRFMPPMYIPYSQMIVSDTQSLAWEFKAMGGFTEAIHPYYSQEWNRRQVYPHLGFDRFIAGEDFSQGLLGADKIENITDVNLKGLDFGTDLEYIRGFISDAECYEKVLEELKRSDNDTSFIFAVTVQNHGGFDYEGDDFQNVEFVPGEDELNQYLTCSQISDRAFHELIQTLSGRKKQTIVLMFGDHQPYLDIESYVEGYSESETNLYFVPYVLWSNTPLKGEFPETLSVNYLSAVLKQSAGLPLTAWDRLRLAAMATFPVVTRVAVMDHNLETVTNEDAPVLEEYRITQYMRTTSNLS